MAVFRFRFNNMRIDTYWPGQANVSAFCSPELDITTSKPLGDISPALGHLGYEYVETDPTTPPGVWTKNAAGVLTKQTPVDSLVPPTPSAPTRAFGTAFTPSATRATLCIYSVRLASSVTLGGDGIALAQLLSDTAATPSTVRDEVRARNALLLGVGVSMAQEVTANLVYLVPPNHKVLLNKTESGGATATLVRQTESTL